VTLGLFSGTSREKTSWNGCCGFKRPPLSSSQTLWPGPVVPRNGVTMFFLCIARICIFQAQFRSLRQISTPSLEPSGNVENIRKPNSPRNVPSLCQRLGGWLRLGPSPLCVMAARLLSPKRRRVGSSTSPHSRNFFATSHWGVRCKFTAPLRPMARLVLTAPGCQAPQIRVESCHFLGDTLQVPRRGTQ